MAVTFYGQQVYGRVHAHEGEYVETQFFHIDWLPLFPIESYWITRRAGADKQGFPIKLHLRSVAAAYLRVWGLGLSIVALATTGGPGFIAACAFAALCAWSWTWRSLPRSRHRRSDFNRVAYGARCEPAWLTTDHRARLEAELRAKWSKRADARPPDDVARFGANDPEEAVLAYGMLRLAGVAHREADGAADRLLASAFETTVAEGGPYRETTAAESGAFGEVIARVAATQAEALRAEQDANRPRRWFHRPWVQLIGLLLATPGAMVAVALAFGDTGTHDLTSRQLDKMIEAPYGFSRVTCERVEEGWFMTVDNRVSERIWFCWLGKRMLPLVVDADVALPQAGAATVGRLHQMNASADRHTAPWEVELRRDARLDAASFEYYLDVSDGAAWKEIVPLLAFAGLVGIGWAFWIRARFTARARRAA
jgi:hypothetical protein